jgi:hypothetical protein
VRGSCTDHISGISRIVRERRTLRRLHTKKTKKKTQNTNEQKNHSKPRDVPFGVRFKATFRYYDAPWEPQLYRNKPAFKVACNQSANAYITSNMALHPYWFKEFGLDRWCRRDVCMSVWTQDHSHDLMFKITDVCPPSICKTPFEVRVESWKASYLFYHSQGPRPTQEVYAYISPCWADGLPQPDLEQTLPGPKLLNSRHWMLKKLNDQFRLNQEWAMKHGKPVRALGALVRPWATIYPGQLRDFKPEDWPKGSERGVIEQYKRKLTADG